jgi:hypothetical protein
MTGLPTGAEPREQLWSLWQHWMNWAVAYPEKRRALAQLGVSDVKRSCRKPRFREGQMAVGRP